MRLVHGAVIYDVNQQNVCLTDSLTIDQQKEEIRQLIFFSGRQAGLRLGFCRGEDP